MNGNMKDGPSDSWLTARYDTCHYWAAAHLRYWLFDYLCRSYERPMPIELRTDLDNFKHYIQRGADDPYGSGYRMMNVEDGGVDYQIYAYVPTLLHHEVVKLYIGPRAIYPYRVGVQCCRQAEDPTEYFNRKSKQEKVATV